MLFYFLSRHRAASISRKECSDAKVALCCRLPWRAQGLDQGWTAHSRLVHFSIFSAMKTPPEILPPKQTNKQKKPNNCVAEASNLFQKKKNPTGSFIYQSSISTRYARTPSRERRSGGTRQMSHRAEARWREPSRRNEAIGTAEREGPLIRRRWSTRRGRSPAC